ESLVGLHAHAFQALAQLLKLLLEPLLAFLQLLERFGKFLRCHWLALATIRRPAILALHPFHALLAPGVLAIVAVLAGLHLVEPVGLIHHFLLAPHDLAELVYLLAHLVRLLVRASPPAGLQ